ncbi:sigma-54-dependent transcriptional regulator [Rickettsia endosymbiont of Cardiosporidium cionae]|uniref:sigma-54-dependent transcriptional regulator n=1 Tax=Rickettsia endosymbiont of Cardiosporidium cionae TaxID=2777155 RepID=UPI003899C484|nr:sigma-54-dependent Fis family transcriptional regulator [Rickettsia endosymbiont of Cardiosporidium cionae]
MALNVLIVDDEMDICNLISDTLDSRIYSTRVASNSYQALEEITKKIPNVIVLDVWLQGSEIDGLGILEIVKERYPFIPVIMISGHGTIKIAVEAIKMGAYDYLEKPFSHEKLLILIQRATEATLLKKENIELRSKVLDKLSLVGNSATITKFKSSIDKVASSSARIMIFGAVGSGKELTAKLIHKQSDRTTNPFVVFNPSLMTENKIMSELFGDTENNNSNVYHLLSKRLTILEAANTGVLYIDEITELPIKVQKRLIQFLQDQTIVRNGQSIKLDIRFITSTSKNIQSEIDKHNFRLDLYYRLNVISLKVPMLGEHKDDIPALVEYFVEQLSNFSGLKKRNFSSEALAALQSYDWPGNIRQLRNVVEWTLIMTPICDSECYEININMLPKEILDNKLKVETMHNHTNSPNIDMMSMPLREAREVFERQYLAAQMNRFNNNISKTSNFVGMERSALHRKLKMLSISSEKYSKLKLEAL